MVPWPNTEGLASAAQGMGAHVLRGPVRYAAPEGTLHVGDVEIEELLHEMAAEEVLVIVAPLRVTPEPRSICRACGRAHLGSHSPVCKAEEEEAKRVLQERLLFDEGFPRLPCW
jgi:hypothetical protein